MHALGNNYVYVSEYEERLDEEELEALAVRISDVRKGIGSDGLILIGPSEVADVRMRIFNADGSEAETCGNGLRCVAKYAYDRGYVSVPQFRIETKGGTVSAMVHVEDSGSVHRVTIDMGEARFGGEAVHFTGPEDVLSADSAKLDVNGETYEGVLVSMGNPHFVQFVSDVATVPVAIVGPQIEQHRYFPERINVEFVHPLDDSELDFRVWERGSGVTYACGTGACASVAAGFARGLLASRVLVHLLGGDLEVEIREGHVWMTGEAVTVFTGDFAWPS